MSEVSSSTVPQILVDGADASEVVAILKFCAEHRIQYGVTWRLQDGDFQFFLEDNPTDFLRFTSADFPAIEMAFADVLQASPEFGRGYGVLLFLYRRAGRRPVDVLFPEIESLRPLFNACGPERKDGEL